MKRFRKLMKADYSDSSIAGIVAGFAYHYGFNVITCRVIAFLLGAIAPAFGFVLVVTYALAYLIMDDYDVKCDVEKDYYADHQ